MYYVYILICSDLSFYVGFTSDLKKRLEDHNSAKGGNYTRSRRPCKLVYKENYSDIQTAIKREIQLKGWSQKKKIALIKQNIEKLKTLSKSKK